MARAAKVVAVAMAEAIIGRKHPGQIAVRRTVIGTFSRVAFYCSH